MPPDTLLRMSADLILFVHVIFVAFVVFGLLLVCLGKVRRWNWVQNPWFRIIHLLAIGIVVALSWAGRLCPLTTLERSLRTQAGSAVYTGSFLAYWLSRLIYYQAPQWVFTLIYTVFGLVVLWAWIWVRPRGLK